MKIAHIINPVKVGQSSDLFLAQPVTFESIRRARVYTEEIDSGITIRFLTTQFPEDHEIIPDYFERTPDLERSIQNFGTFRKQRKLPLIADILNRAYDAGSNADYLVYTNVDIAVMPFFYTFIKEKIETGLDAFVINRKTISDTYGSVSQLASMYAETGEGHPGYDCFVFKRDLFPKMKFEHICIGAQFVGLAFYLNLRLLTKKFYEFGDEHVTFHIGNDQEWKNEINNQYKTYNENEFIKIRTLFKENKFDIEQILNEAFPLLKNTTKKGSKEHKTCLGLLRRFLRLNL